MIVGYFFINSLASKQLYGEDLFIYIGKALVE